MNKTKLLVSYGRLLTPASDKRFNNRLPAIALLAIAVVGDDMIKQHKAAFQGVAGLKKRLYTEQCEMRF